MKMRAMVKYIIVDITSLKAVTIGPEATAGSTPIFANVNGDSTPNVEAVRQAPKSPALTMTLIGIGLVPI